MKKKHLIILRVILAAILVFSVAMALWQYLDHSGGAESYDAARDLATASQPRQPAQPTVPADTQPPDPTEAAPEMIPIWIPAPVEDPVMEEMAQLDLQALQQENPDVIGWIRIPGTQVDYPLLQGEDNSFYLNNTWQKIPSTVGSIYLEAENDPGLRDFNSIIYGHNMRNGSMFATVRQYSSQGWFETYPYVYIRIDAGVLRYEVFSAYSAYVDSDTYQLSFYQEQTRRDYIAMALEQSDIETGITPETTDQILTLSTCSGIGYETRFVVHARLPMIQVEVPAYP